MVGPGMVDVGTATRDTVKRMYKVVECREFPAVTTRSLLDVVSVSR